MLTSRSLVLKPVDDEDALFDRLEKCVQSWFKSYDLFLLHSDTREEEGVTTAVWLDAARTDFELRLVGDDVADMNYVTIVPDAQTDTETLLGELAKCFESYQPEGLLPEVIARPQDTGAWTRLAISMNGQHDERVEALLLANLAGPDPERLGAAAMAAMLLRWPELAAPLRAALARPIPEAVRPALKLALQACEV